MYDTFPERCVPIAVTEVGFLLINAVLCLESQFEDIAIMCHLTENSMPYKF